LSKLIPQPLLVYGSRPRVARVEFLPVASVDYHDARMARGSQPAGEQPRFSRFVRRGASFHCCWGVRARAVCRPRHVFRVQSLVELFQACEKGRPRLQLRHKWGRARSWQASCAHQRVSSVAPRARAAVYGGLLCAARSAVACPGCPWGGAAWHAGAVHLSPDGGPPRQHPAVGVREVRLRLNIGAAHRKESFWVLLFVSLVALVYIYWEFSAVLARQTTTAASGPPDVPQPRSRPLAMQARAQAQL